MYVLISDGKCMFKCMCICRGLIHVHFGRRTNLIKEATTQGAPNIITNNPSSADRISPILELCISNYIHLGC
jgi:hypothetical protein